MKIWFLFCSFLIASLWVACESWELEPQDFIQIEMAEPEALSIDSVRLSAKIMDWKVAETIGEHGFIWNEGANEPSLTNQEGKLSLGAKTKGDSVFSVSITLSPATQYTIRAFVETAGEVFYSQSWEYETGTAKVITLPINYVGNDQLEFFGQLTDTEKGIIAAKHGFCWSALNPSPTLEDEFVNLGTRRNNNTFSYILEELINEEPIYYRAFAVLQVDFVLDTIYGEADVFDGNLNFWTRKADFSGGARRHCVGFSIGNKGYAGLGSNDLGGYNDFWSYDPIRDDWTQLSDFDGGDRSGAVGISIGDKGYVGTGRQINGGGEINDFWEYDPQTNLWIRKADFPGDSLHEATAFSIGDKGYVGTGNSLTKGITAAFYEYSPQTDTWRPIADYGGGPRSRATGLSIGNKGYVVMGGDSDEVSQKDTWEYDPQTNVWTQKADFGGGQGESAVGFSIEGKGYVGTGSIGSLSDELWEYDPASDRWYQRADYGGGVNRSSIAFVINGKGYVGTGFTVSRATNEFWEFDP